MTHSVTDQDCDVLIIGAGPAGSAAASAAACAGADVIIVERRRTIGATAQCAGFIPAPAISAAAMPPGVVIQAISTMSIITPDGCEQEVLSPGFIVERDRFDQALAAQARYDGARIWTGMRAISHQDGCTEVKGGGHIARFRSANVIGADGPASAAGAWSGAVNTDLLAGAQYTLPLTQPSDRIRLYFHRRLYGGYGWVFPRGDTANVGVAVRAEAGVKPAQALKWFVEKVTRQGIVGSQRLSATGGMIPVNGPVFSRHEDVLLAGDAGGLCHPLTGAGISLALQSGELAGETAAAAALGGGSAAMRQYTEQIDELMGEALKRAVMRRRHLYRHESGNETEFSRAVRKSWMGIFTCEQA